ncbi:hypothetical protein [uncultured Bosea sp.]|uniref:hypothetical protein n=1 Tax=uncultured Bosea sp. TaxID=211457 RepID=UPI0025D0065D|nr:hypothetical protein [uncultured Bosea sp.]
MLIHMGAVTTSQRTSMFAGASGQEVIEKIADWCRRQPIVSWPNQALLDEEVVGGGPKKIVDAYFTGHPTDRYSLGSDLVAGRLVPIAPDFRFEINKTYPTLSGKLVKIIALKDDLTGYETVQGDDREEEDLGHRYNRTTGVMDQGRCTGSPDDRPENLIPVAIDDARIV